MLMPRNAPQLCETICQELEAQSSVTTRAQHKRTWFIFSVENWRNMPVPTG